MQHPAWILEQQPLNVDNKFLSEEHKQFLTANPDILEEYNNRAREEVQRLISRTSPGAWVEDTLRQRIR
jgi:hypothetical protein